MLQIKWKHVGPPLVLFPSLLWGVTTLISLMLFLWSLYSLKKKTMHKYVYMYTNIKK